MKWFTLSLRATALTVVALVLGGLATGASAQYPPPTGNVSVGISNSTPTTGSTVAVSATVMDQTGAVMPGLVCTFEIASQPGTDAVVDPGPKTTDQGGVVTSTLAVGSIPGTIVVDVTCGQLMGQVSVVVSPSGPQGAPAASMLPPTGTGPVQAVFIGLHLAVALLAGGALAVAIGSALRLKARRVRRDS